MDILIRSAHIVAPNSRHHGQQRDILISNGKIKEIKARITGAKGKEIKSENLYVSPGWMDMNTTIFDPGHEYREDISSGANAAAAGGFTAICMMPATSPALHSKSEIEYVVNKAQQSLIDIYPIGAITRDTAGHDITEMHDMHMAGAIAFGDGNKPIREAGMMERSLLYVKAFNGFVISHPEDRSISLDGDMHEGEMSTRLGLKGAPALAEELAIVRDIYLLGYTESKLHFINVSTAKGVELIKEAKKNGLHVTASANAYNLCLTDEVLDDFDTNYKLNPHLRSKEDMMALRRGLKDGIIDTITSGHLPLDEESKKLEFDLATFGMLGLETAFPLALKGVGRKGNMEVLVSRMAIRPRQICGLALPDIETGAEANLSLFDPDVEWVYEESNTQSKSRNSPFFGQKLQGKALGIIKGKQSFFNA